MQISAQLLNQTSADGYQVLTLNRPDALNALRSSLLRELAEALKHAQADPTIKAVIVTGGAKVFAAGADIRELQTKTPIDVLQDERAALWRQIAGFSKPLIAAVNGYALGAGNELVLHADIVIAGEDASFGQPEINLGLMPGAGGSFLLARRIGQLAAMKLTLTGETISATEALRLGLVSEVVAPEHTIARARELATRIARKAPIAAQLIRESIQRSPNMSLDDARAFERKAFALVFATQDSQEGISAFVEKRKPIFSGC